MIVFDFPAGWHWRISLATAPRFLNLPAGPHRIIIIGMGRCSRRGVFHPWQPCVQLMALRYCCRARVRELS